MLVNDLKTEAESHHDSEQQKKLLAAAKVLADATARMVEAAKVRQRCFGIFCILFLSHQGSRHSGFSINFCQTSSLTPASCMASFTTSKYLLFGLPHLLFPGNCISSTFLPHSPHPDVF